MLLITVTAAQSCLINVKSHTELPLAVISLLDRQYVLRDDGGLGVGNTQYGSRGAILARVSQKGKGGGIVDWNTGAS